MKIQVGLLGKSLGWEELLRQEGVPYTMLVDGEAAQECSAVVLTDTCGREEIETARRYLSRGGALLCPGKISAQLTGLAPEKRFITYLLPDREGEFSGGGMLDLFVECDIPGGANRLRREDGGRALFLGDYGGGDLAVLPFDAGAFLHDHRVSAKSFYARRQRLPHERVSTVSRGTVRHLAARTLELLHHRRGLPYLHRWYFPRDARGLFAFRIDADRSDRPALEGLYRLAEEMAVPCSWFVHVRQQEKFLELFSAMKGHEIGVHCYDHLHYRDERTASDDLRKAVGILNNAGIEPKGFCAPYGTWNRSAARAVEQFGFEYSSEFSYDYENLPSYPASGERLTTLQLPVHPISIGGLRRQGCGEEEMRVYYADTLERMTALRVPAIVYHHPNNGHEAVLRDILARAREMGLPLLRMIDYAAWWKRRGKMSVGAELHGTIASLRTGDAADDVWLHITKGEGTETFIPVQPAIDLEKGEWKPRPAGPALPEDLGRVRRFNPWIAINYAEDRIHRLLAPHP